MYGQTIYGSEIDSSQLWLLYPDQHLEERLVAQDIRILAAVDRRLEKMEERFAESLDDLTKTLDKFLKRLTDIEEEFIFMKEDLKRVKAVIREKLGVSLD